MTRKKSQLLPVNPETLKNKEFKFKLTLSEEQKKVKADAYLYDVNVVLGNYASGKTVTSCAIALDMLFKKQVTKIYISRPIDFKATGFLQGSVKEKLYFHTLPVFQNFYSLYDKAAIDKLHEEGVIEIIPIDYMKGMNFTPKSITIIDEFEDITYKEFELILSRLCKEAKLFFVGSEQQIDIKNSCICKIKKLKDSGLVGYNVLTSNHRNEKIFEILDYLKENV